MIATETRAEPGSFRDRSGRVFYYDGSVYRALDARALAQWRQVSQCRFILRAMDEGRLVSTREVSAPPGATLPPGGPWEAVLWHETIPCISYPYEWPFGMLQDAAALHLELLLEALEEDVILKDASAYNVQWIGTRPIFIDVPSFEAYRPGQIWAGYRQFCQLFLYPLLLQAYRGVPYQPLLRGALEGFDAATMSRLLGPLDVLRPGVFSHVWLQAKLQAHCGATQRDVRAEVREAGYGKELLVASVRGLLRLVKGLRCRDGASTWSEYAEQTPYTEEDRGFKDRFVGKVLAARRWGTVWDLGANTGHFARMAAAQGASTIAMDYDPVAVDRMYRSLRGASNLLPLVMDVANPSPGLGWRGCERKSLAQRRKPDLTLCLALLHHAVIGANIPTAEMVDWLRSLDSALLVEFVTREDPMVGRLLRNKDDQYGDYDVAAFEACLGRSFRIERKEAVSTGTRVLYMATPS